MGSVACSSGSCSAGLGGVTLEFKQESVNVELSLSSSASTPVLSTTIVPGYLPTSVTSSNSTPAQSGPSCSISLSAIVVFVGSASGVAYATCVHGRMLTAHTINAMARMSIFFL